MIHDFDEFRPGWLCKRREFLPEVETLGEAIWEAIEDLGTSWTARRRFLAWFLVCYGVGTWLAGLAS